MPIECTLLQEEPEPFDSCPKCGHEPRETRPSKAAADTVIRQYLAEVLPRYPTDGRIHLHPDGEDGWSFWILNDDTTSYVHSDLRIEWYGTDWEPGYDEDL